MNTSHTSIPISIALNEELNEKEPLSSDKKRLFLLSVTAIAIALVISFVARFLVYLINFFTDLFFYGRFSIDYLSPAGNHLGWYVIFIPIIGGAVVGLMAYYGSKAIRGHGIPEAMEQILTNQSRIKPAITYLKPLSAAISIGSGGPFGAEGPIIATGGAFGSSIGQLLKISSNERKILLAAGATAGMSAIFGTPLAAIFLAIELLLFEFSPRSIIPVSLACITGAAGHHFLFEAGPTFPMPVIDLPNNYSIAFYSLIGVLMGFIATGVTKLVYFIEDCFEKLPMHWALWPALGGLIVGVIGYFAPHTLGVGYDNITNLLSGTLSFQIVFSLCVFKFISWAFALGSGTSGGTLAPLLTIGGATGILLSKLLTHFFPELIVSYPLAALIGMSAMFAGASRAVLTSIIFSLEATNQSNALLPLLGACIASYIVSFFIMENTIMTEKIARRGVKTPDHYEPDLLETLVVGDVMEDELLVLNKTASIKETKTWLIDHPEEKHSFFAVLNDDHSFSGIVSQKDILISNNTEGQIESLVISTSAYIKEEDSLKRAVKLMNRKGLELLPVVKKVEGSFIVKGVLGFETILKCYASEIKESERTKAHFSIKQRSMRLLVRGNKVMSLFSKN